MRSAFLVPFATALLVAALPAQAPAELHFGWPQGAEATVTESISKRGRTAVTRYRIALAPTTAADGTAELRLQIRDFEFVALEGVDLDDPRVRDAMAPTLALAQAVPDLRIAADGTYLGAEDMAATVDRLLDSLRRQQRLPRARLDAMERTLRSPHVAPLLARAGQDFWNCWVGAWTGVENQPGRTNTFPTELPPAFGTAQGEATFRHHGAVAEPAGHVWLGLENVMTGGDAGQGLLAFVRATFPEALAESGKALPNDLIQDLRLVTRAEVITDPATLLPHRASYEKEMELRLQGESAPRRGLERHVYRFEWRAAGG